MTPLRQRLIEDQQLRGFSPRTQEAYVHAVHQLAQHFHKSPALITDEDLRGYFLHLTQVQHYARATVTIALCGIKLFVEHTCCLSRYSADGFSRSLLFVAAPRDKKSSLVRPQAGCVVGGIPQVFIIGPVGAKPGGPRQWSRSAAAMW
jgi:hypothetical protein